MRDWERRTESAVLAVGLLPLAVQLRRVSTSASTPPG